MAGFRMHAHVHVRRGVVEVLETIFRAQAKLMRLGERRRKFDLGFLEARDVGVC